MKRTAFITIGQSPRNDILDSMLPTDLHGHILQRGALDNLSRGDVAKLEPDARETPFVTRLSDGTDVLVSKRRLMPFLQSAIDDVERNDVSAVVVLCTGSFPDLTASVPLIFPDNVLRATVGAVLASGRIGVVMPHIDQMIMMREKWETPTRSFFGVALSPYSSSVELRSITEQLIDASVDLIVLDCMGFSAELKEQVASATGVPVVLSNRLIGRVIEELIPVKARIANRSHTS
jgi:protein AroM